MKHPHGSRSHDNPTLRILLLLLIPGGLAILAAMSAGCQSEVPEAQQSRTYVGRSSCAECHSEEASLFEGSHHDKAMDVASEQTVLGDFDDKTIEHFGITSRMFRDGDRFMVNTEGPDGEMQDFEIGYVFGVHPLQQYMVEIQGPRDVESGDGKEKNLVSDAVGKLQVLRISWDVDRKEWFYLSPPDVSEKLEPDDPLHWTGFTQCWNTSCAFCHSTDLKKNYDHHSNQFATTWSEIDVSCESCHGPASLHVHLAQEGHSLPHDEFGFGLAKLKADSNLNQIESCAPCHSRRAELTESWHAGGRFDDHFSCSLLSTGVYHNDGQIRDEDYVYGSFIQSKMFHNGIRCTDCHDPHSTKVKFPDNRLCTSCHQHPAAKYDSISHHHHSPGTPGASCVECHMPATTYMGIDARRDHSFRIPRPDFSVSMNTPNACTACHIETVEFDDGNQRPDQYLDWVIASEDGDETIREKLNAVDLQMAEAFAKWYPEQDVTVPRTTYYQRLSEGRTGDDPPVDVLRELAVDRTAPAIVRATALDSLAEREDLDSLQVAIDAIDDSDPKVVSAAIRLLDFHSIREMERIQYSGGTDLSALNRIVRQIGETLTHPVRLVRIEAARALVAVSPDVRDSSLDRDTEKSLQTALKELVKAFLTGNDRATTHMTLGSIYLAMDQPDRASDAYRTAIRVDPAMTGPRSNLAGFLETRSRILAAKIASEPPGSVTYQSVTGMIDEMSSEIEQLRREDHELLRRDVDRVASLSSSHVVHYRFAMSSYMQQDFDAVVEHLLIALEQQPRSTTYLLALATFYVQQEQWAPARTRVDQLLEIQPDNPGYLSLDAEISKHEN